MSSPSTMTSMCFPTRRWIGRLPPGSRPTATWWSRPGFARFRSIRRCRALPTGAKAGFDLTFPIGWKRDGIQAFRSRRRWDPREITVRQALEQGPQSFRDFMEATGSRDGRDVLVALDAVRRQSVSNVRPTAAIGLSRETKTPVKEHECLSLNELTATQDQQSSSLREETR